MTVDWDKERKRLRHVYADMEDGELQKIARDADGLTDVARDELQAEMGRRGIKTPAKRSKADAKQPGPAPVMVGRYFFLPDAQVAKSILDSAGIESFLADENLVRMDWLYANAVGGIKLLVRHEDAETARKLLEESSAEPSEAE